MLAIDLFEQLEYKQVRNDDDYVIYESIVDEDCKKVLTFSSQLENFCIEFKQVVPSRQVPSIDADLFKAIQQQLRELGWFNIKKKEV